MNFPCHPTAPVVARGKATIFPLVDTCSARYPGVTYVGESPEEERRG